MTTPREDAQSRVFRRSFEPYLRLITVLLCLMAFISFFSAPVASFLAVTAGFAVVVAAKMSRVTVAATVAQSGTGLASLYFLGESMLTRSAEYLALGVVLSVVALLVVYIEEKIAVLKCGLGMADILAVSATAVALALTFTEASSSLGGYLEGFTWDPQEFATLSGLLYIGATLPISSLIPLALTYLVYSTLRSIRTEELFQASEEASDLSENSVILNT